MGLFKSFTTKKKSQPEQSSGSAYAPPSGPPRSSYAPPQVYQPRQPPQQQGYAPPSAPPPPLAGARGVEDPLAALARYDTSILVDDSESMEMFWPELSESLATVISKAVQYDSDGVDIAFYNNRTKATSRSAAELLQLFRRVEPRKSTPTASALFRVLDPYISELENWNMEGKPVGAPRPKPMNLIVLTDGAPDRGEDPEALIVDIAKRLDKGRFPPYQLGIQFVQIGIDEEAADHLRSLDDDLKTKHGIRDMCDTTLFPQNGVVSSDYILKALLGGMNRSIDKQN